MTPGANVDPKKTARIRVRRAEQSNLTGLPEAVRITLLLDSNPKKKQPDSAIRAKSSRSGRSFLKPWHG
jgi:hypothetical protein